MARIRKAELLIFPILGFILGIVGVYAYLHGIFAVWHFVGRPDEKIARIVGVKAGNNLLVLTESGKHYSFGFSNGNVSVPHVVWNPEPIDAVDTQEQANWGAHFITLPPLIWVKQLYTLEYPLIEGVGEVKFALSPTGNVWMWNFSIGSLAGLFYYFFPPLGLLLGLVVALADVWYRKMAGAVQL